MKVAATSPPHEPSPARPRLQDLDLIEVLKASLIFVAVSGVTAILWVVRDALLLVFTAVIAAILLRVFADAISRWTRLPVALSLALGVLAIVVFALAVAWLFGTHVAMEFSDVIKRATDASNAITAQLKNAQLGGLGRKIEQSTTPEIGSSVRQGVSLLTEAAEAMVVLVVSAIYLALEPHLYRIGMIKLFKSDLQEWAGERVDILGQTMKLWLFGQLLTMLLVGALSGLACWLIGVPGPIALGVISFLTEAIPYLGPFLGASRTIQYGNWWHRRWLRLVGRTARADRVYLVSLLGD